jgi:hypothetical protein
MRQGWVSTGLLALTMYLGFVSVSPATADTIAAWTEATGSGTSLRAIVSDACPAALVDGKSVTLKLRAEANGAFPDPICQADLPAGSATVQLGDRALHPLPAAINRMVVLGDTGCRLKGSFVQDCNDAAKWPFAAVAAHAATEHPDLVVHVGDYYYRETPCPPDAVGCAGSPSGDRWPAWRDDFFVPAAPLLAAAPWIFVRGNHEQCGRGGVGWFRLLDAGAVPLSCPAAAASFAVPVDGSRFYVVDSADTEDAIAPPAKVARFKGELAQLGPQLSRGTGWILTHRPIWGFVPERSGEIEESDELPVNRTEQEAVAHQDLAGVQLVLSGHVHIFTAASFGAVRPAQLIVGNGGDTRDGDLPGSITKAVRIAELPADAFVVEQFGYLVLDRTSAGWAGTLKDTEGHPLATCTIAGRDLHCAPAAR